MQKITLIFGGKEHKVNHLEIKVINLINFSKCTIVEEKWMNAILYVRVLTSK